MINEIILRPYQVEAVKKGLEFFKRNESGGEIIFAPTGSGKSLIIAAIVKELNEPVIILQPNITILEQNKEKMEYYGFKPSIFSASANQKNIGDITLATIGSIINYQNEFLKFKNIIIDECHLVNSNEGLYNEFIQSFEKAKILGLTATPFRLKGKECKILTRTRPSIFKDFCYIIQNYDIWKNNFLARIEYLYPFQNYNTKEIKLNSSKTNFDEKALREYNTNVALVDVICKVVEEHKNRKHILVFTTFIEEAEQLALKLKKMGISAASITSKDNAKKQREIKELFKKGEIKVVINSKLLAIGYDLPELDCIIDGGATLSLNLYMQKLGRGVRIANFKQNLLYIDVVKNSKKFGKIEEYKLNETYKGWELSYRNIPLTGVSVHTLNVEKTHININHNNKFNNNNYKNNNNNNNYKKFNNKNTKNNFVLTFGKFKGLNIRDPKVPLYYINWVIKKFSNGFVKSAFEEEKRKRLKNT